MCLWRMDVKRAKGSLLRVMVGLAVMTFLSPAHAVDLLSDHAASQLRQVFLSSVAGDRPFVVFQHAYSDRLAELRGASPSPIIARAGQAYGEDAKRGCETTSSSTLQDAYLKAFSSAQWSQDLLNNEDGARLAQISQLLWSKPDVPTPGYANYLKYRDIYQAALQALNALPPARRTAQANAAVKTAQDDLDTVGERTRYEAASTNFGVLQPLSVNTGKKEFLALLHANDETITHPSLANLSSWATYQFVINLDPADQTSWSGSNLGLTFEAASVKLDRRWLNNTLLQDHSWRWPAGSNQPQLADGQGGGSLGVIVDEIVLVKSIRITVASVQTLQEKIAEASRTNEQVTLGPFAVLSRESSVPPFTAEFDPASNSVGTDSVTAFGCVLRALPAAPDPNSAYKW